MEYGLRNGKLQGTVVFPGGIAQEFAGADELERCLGGGRGHLVLVDANDQDADREALAELTATEYDVVREVATGASNREIAERLFYSVKSVEAYLTRIYRHLGVEGRSGLVELADGIEDLEPLPEQAELVSGGSARPRDGHGAERTVVAHLFVCS